MAPSNGSSQFIIHGVLKRIDRKVRFNRVIDHFSIALCLLLATIVSVRLIGMVVPITVPETWLVAAIAAGVYALYFAWSQIGARQLGLAAGVADDRGKLHDELKSAYWFMDQDHHTDWTDVQVERATETARHLQVKQLVPTEVPQRLWAALALAAILVALGFVPSGPPLLAFASGGPAQTDGLTAEQEDQLDEIRELVDQAQELEQATPEDEQLVAEAQQRIDDAMERLAAEELSMEELMRELREAQNALEEGNLDMAAMQEALEEMAQDMEGSQELGDLAEAMQNQNMAEAADMMRQMAENLQNMSPEQMQQMAEQMQQAAQGDQQSMEELMEALQEAAEALSDEQMADAQEAMQQAADAMQQMQQRMDAQQMMNEAGQQMQQMQQSMSEQQLAQQMQQMMPSEQSGGESQEGAMAMPSDDVQKSASSGETGDPSQQGGPAGHATSEAMEGAEMQLGQATTLEVQLEMEVVDKEQNPLEPEEPPDPEDIFQEASRQETATVEYRNVRRPSNYAEGSALSVEQIPWRYRNLVKRYFLAIRPRENQ